MSAPESGDLLRPSLRLGLLLRDARERLDVRQEDVARAVGIGTSSYRSLESGTSRGPNLYTVLELLDYLGVDAAELGRLGANVPESADGGREPRIGSTA